MASPNPHEPFKALGPVEWNDVPQDSLPQFLDDIFSETQTVIESIPTPTATNTSGATGRARSKTESAALHPSGIQRGVSQRQKAASLSQAVNLRKEWKEIKVNPKENSLGINVYKLSSKDGRGSWFARRSVHEGLSFENWKQGLAMEFAETMKVQGSPGSGNIRGIGADKKVEDKTVEDVTQLQVFQLSAQFPGPTAPRDFVTLLLTTETPAKAADGTRAPRQYMIVSKPCVHPDCPPRQGFIRGYYESVEIIREVPSEMPPPKRFLSSDDLGRNDGRRLSTSAGSDTEQEGPSMAVEWLMVTRSDPGGSVPRFLIEKGTPPGIVGDAGKFLKWVTAQALRDLSRECEDDTCEETEQSEDTERTERTGKTERVEGTEGTESDKEKKPELPRRPITSQIRHHEHLLHERLHQELLRHEQEAIPSSSGLYEIIAGAIGAAGSLVASGLFSPFRTFSDVESNDGSHSEIPQIQEEDDEDDHDQHDKHSQNDQHDQNGQNYRDDQHDQNDQNDKEDNESDTSETSSIRTFASALERSLTEHKTPESITETQSETSHSNPSTQQEKELKKLQARRRKLDEKVAKLQERQHHRLQGEKEKDAATIAKLREKHEREVAKQEEKYRRELRRLEEKREAEQRKAEERKRKALEKEERANLAIELEKVKAERDLARKQVEILESQVGELQAQNTMLVRKLGQMGVLKRGDSTSSMKSLMKLDAKASPLVP